MTDIGPGTRVECIKEDFGLNRSGEPAPANAPKRGGVYTVAWAGDDLGFAYLALVECPVPGGKTQVYRADYFRPMGGTKTGMAILREAAIPKPAKVGT